MSILAGAGVVGAFGFAILGISRYRQAGNGDTVDRVSSVALVVVGGGFCLAAVVLGLT